MKLFMVALCLSFAMFGCGGGGFNELKFSGETSRVWGTSPNDVWEYVAFEVNHVNESHFNHWNGSTMTRIETPAVILDKAGGRIIQDETTNGTGKTWLIATTTTGKNVLFLSMDTSGTVEDHSDFFPTLAAGDGADVYSRAFVMSRGGLVFISTYVEKRGPLMWTFENGVATVVAAPTGPMGGLVPLCLIAANDVYGQAPLDSSQPNYSAGRLVHWDGTAWSDVTGINPTVYPRSFSVNGSDVWLSNNNQSMNNLGLYKVYRRDGAAFTEVEITVKAEASIPWLPIGLIAQGGGRFSFIGNTTVTGDTDTYKVLASRTFDGTNLAPADHQLTPLADCKGPDAFPGVCEGGIGLPLHQLDDGTLLLVVGGLVRDPKGPQRVYTVPRSSL